MNWLSLKIITVFAVIPLLLLTSLSSGFGYVWCVGNNGHSVVEQCQPVQEGEDSAVTDSPIPLIVDANLSASDSACGSCQDTAIASPVNASKNLRSNSPHDHISISATSGFTCQNLDAHLVRRVTLPLTRESQGILTQRMVVLLI